LFTCQYRQSNIAITLVTTRSYSLFILIPRVDGIIYFLRDILTRRDLQLLVTSPDISSYFLLVSRQGKILPALAPRQPQIVPKWKEHRRSHTFFLLNKVGSHDHPGLNIKMIFFSFINSLLLSLKHSLLDFVHSLWHSIPPQPNIDSIASVLIKGLCFLDRFCTPFILTFITLCVFCLLLSTFSIW